MRPLLKNWAEWLGSLFFPENRHPGHSLWSLFWVSVATLYIEVMIIRWVGTEVRVFAYFQNLALIACFLGFGLGCYWSGRRKSLFLGLVAIAALVALVEAPVDRWQEFLRLLSAQLSLLPDAALWGFLSEAGDARPLWLFAGSVITVGVFLALLVTAMIPLGQWVGFYLETAPQLIGAYSVNLLGSVSGLWVFAGLSFLWLSPGYWFGLAFALLLIVRPPSRRSVAAGLVLLGSALLLLRFGPTSGLATYWSPYQKLGVMSLEDRQYFILVNNTGYMTIANVTPQSLSLNPGLARVYRAESSYDSPYRFAPRPDRVLIVGAGAGNDAAAALRNGAGQVDAVEIDPLILSLGERLHPEAPYASPKVHKVVNDARAFLRQTKEKYDVIVFGLLDSHTQFSDYSNMRIDNYVYTEQAFREARRRLQPDGVLVVKFEVREPWTWMGQRFYAMLTHVFGRPPIVFYAPGLAGMTSATVFITSDGPELAQRAAQPELSRRVMESPPPFRPEVVPDLPTTTDDWPYVYHRSRSIPTTYLTVSVILLGMATLLVRRVIEPRQVSTWHFFFLGAGFLLLETQLISRLALYFGTTWLVNCIALTAILFVLVAANAYVARVRPQRLGPYYVLLVAGLLANYFIPWQRLPYGARSVGILLSAAYSLPIFFAGVIFTEAFRREARKSSAFGANLMGAVAGGLAQNASFIVGMKALLPIAAAFYAGAALCGRLESRPSGIERPVPSPSAYP